MRRFGISEHKIKQRSQRKQALLLHPDNIKPLQLFTALQTQWRTEAMSTMSSARIIKTGLDYTAIPPTARMVEIKLDKTLFADLRLMEATALKLWSEE